MLSSVLYTNFVTIKNIYNMKKVNINQQNSTLSEVEIINNETGLTPLQEKAVILLVSGKNMTDVSNELNIDRGTLYNWFEKLTVKAYYNRLCYEVKENIQNELLGLYNEAVKAIGSSLKSDNETIKLKTAFWLIERLEAQTTGSTDPREIIKRECTTVKTEWEDLVDTTIFDEAKYKQLCKENNLRP